MRPLEFRTRRHAATVLAAAVAAVLALAGCSPSTDSDPAPDVPAQGEASLLPPAEGTTQYPLTLESPWGETVLAERPERIAVLGNSFNIDVLLALDALPVFATERAVFPSWVHESTISQIEYIDEGPNAAEYSLEALAGTKPDLIIALQYVDDLGEQFERLSAIAPILTFPEETAWNEADWHEAQRLTNEALDLTAAGEEVVSRADARVAAAAAAHPEFAGRTVSVVFDYDDTGMDYYTVPGGLAESFFLLLGFSPNPLAENFAQEIRVSEEQISLIDGDLLIMFYPSEETRAAREANPLFQSLSAVSEGRYVSLIVDESDLDTRSTVWSLRAGASAVGTPWAIDYLVALIEDVDLS